jgi:hypothetical protein
LRSLSDLVSRTGADELILVGQIFDHADRLRSHEIAADVLARAAAEARNRISHQPGASETRL